MADRLHIVVEPDWESHRTVIERSVSQGSAS
jgi:hypothetical protein